MHSSLEFITATSSGLAELVFTYVIDRYTSGNELEPNMTTLAAVLIAENISQILKIPPVWGTTQTRFGYRHVQMEGYRCFVAGLSL